MLTDQELVNIINGFSSKVEKYKNEFDWLEDSEQLLEDFEEAVDF